MSTPHTAPEPSLDTVKTETEIAKMNAEILKIIDERMKVSQETIKIERENRYAPLVYATGFMGAGAGLLAAGAALAKLFLH
jgi:hypothetical protein